MARTVSSEYIKGFNARHARYAVACKANSLRVQGFLYREIAVELGVSISTAWKWVQIAGIYRSNLADIRLTRKLAQSRNEITRARNSNRAPKVVRAWKAEREYKALFTDSEPQAIGRGARVDDSMVGLSVSIVSTPVEINARYLVLARVSEMMQAKRTPTASRSYSEWFNARADA